MLLAEALVEIYRLQERFTDSQTDRQTETTDYITSRRSVAGG